MTPLEGRTAIVTGATRGIGRGCALRLARAGANVAVVYRTLDSAAEYGEELSAPTVPEEIRNLGVEAIGIKADMMNKADIAAMVEQVMDEFGRIDILVNNVGGMLTPVERTWPSLFSDDDLDSIIDINLKTTIHACQAVVPVMRQRKSGAIVNISSTAAIDPGNRQGRLANYGISKIGVIQYTRFLAAEIGPDGVRANAIAAGTIDTARLRATAKARGIGTGSDLEKIPMGRLGTPEDVAGVVEFLGSDQSAYVTGQCISVCGGRTLTPS
ncbi:MAG: SDR family oxidoreductase [Rhodobiaceae bacterium]|nr:SDR family oxidoreductase [Rhodobiaceae bacterium]